MAPGTKTVATRVSAERAAVWSAEAAEAGASIAAWVEEMVERGRAAPAQSIAPRAPRTPNTPARPKGGRARTEICVHRNAPGTFCSRGCD